MNSSLIINAISETIADANNALFQLLSLEPSFYQGDAEPGKYYGFSVPRSLGSENPVRQGYQQYNWQLDVLLDYVLPPSVNIQMETAALLLKTSNAIAQINQLIKPRALAMTGNFRPGELSANQSQKVRHPHLWQVTIVGTAFAESYIYLNREGVFDAKN